MRFTRLTHSKFPPTSEPIIPNMESKPSPRVDPLENLMKQMEPHISGSDTNIDSNISGANTRISGTNTRKGGDEFVSFKPIFTKL